MLKYMGGGFLQGVPARDLSDEEAKRLGKQRLLSSGLYREVGKPVAAENKLAKPQENKKEE